MDARRGSAADRGYGHKWRKARAAFLNQNPLCVECMKDDIVEAATVVDHIDPHRGDMTKFWNRKNWQPLCKHHHDKKTATQDSAFGRNGGVG
jgi:5-methylcytosine-specific restriction protein A